SQVLVDVSATMADADAPAPATETADTAPAASASARAGIAEDTRIVIPAPKAEKLVLVQAK
ncbi:transcriptional regulator, partial [Nocardia nova]|nr:transcriptional regulator [Nocardia nova]